MSHMCKAGFWAFICKSQTGAIISHCTTFFSCHQTCTHECWFNNATATISGVQNS